MTGALRPGASADPTAARLEWINCPACGADAPLPLATAGDLAAEQRWLEQFHARRTRAGAPAARRKDRVEFTEGYPTGVVACRPCRLVYRNPVLPAGLQAAAYEADDYTPESLEAAWRADALRFGPVVARLAAKLGGAGSVLEVGTFAGGFLEAARAGGWRAVGIDVGEQVTGFARRKGLTVLRGDLAELPLPAGAFDAACVWNCFDHVRDPAGTLAALARCVKPGGLLAVRVPNGEFYRAARRLAGSRLRPGGRAGRAPPSGRREDAALAGGPLAAVVFPLLAYNNLLAFPYLCAYGPVPLARLLDRHGFAVEEIRYDTLVPLADRYTPLWAVWEERLLKGLACWGARLLAAATCGRAGLGPWLEATARRRGSLR